MAQVEDQIIAEGAQIIWVLAQTSFGQAGTADGCQDFVEGRGATMGLCVGDGETAPVSEVFHNSPFVQGRGFDMIVDRAEMKVRFSSSHGTPSGNDNLTGQQILEAVQQVKTDLGL